MTTTAKGLAAARARQAAKKRAYRNGLRVFRVTADPLDVAEFVGEAGIAVAANADAETLNRSLTEMLRLWHDGRLGLLVRETDIPDDDAPVD